MDYNQRVRLITASLNEFLRLYKRPEHLDEQTALTELREMAEEMNLLIASTSGQSDLEAQIKQAFRNIRQTYKGRSWPTVSHVVDAMNVSAKVSKPKQAEGKVEAGWRPDTMQIMANRMNAGEAVSDSYLYGRSAVELLKAGLVDRETLRKCRSELYFAAKNACGEDIAKSMEAGWIERHDYAERIYG